MPRNSLKICVVVGAAALIFGASCQKRAPKNPSSDDALASASAEPPPPPKPKPKCESLDEKCVADTATSIPAGPGLVTPPLGWSYAKESTASIAVSPDGDGVLGFMPSDGRTPEKILATLTKLLERFEISEVKVPTLKPRLKKAQSTIPAGSLELSLWEVDKTRQQGKEPKMKGTAGTLLVIVVPLNDDDTVVGAGFVSNAADRGRVSEIMDALKTIRGKK